MTAIPDNLEELDVGQLFAVARTAGVVLSEGNTRESIIRRLQRMTL